MAATLRRPHDDVAIHEEAAAPQRSGVVSGRRQAGSPRRARGGGAVAGAGEGGWSQP